MAEQAVWNWDLVEVGVDWLTATYATERARVAIGTLADRWQRDRAQDGYDLKPWNWNGYRGSVTDGITWGTRDDSAILRISGKFARQHFLAAMCFATNVSRIDIQLTAYNPLLTQGLCTMLARRVGLNRLVESGQTKTQLTVNTPRGETFNIGSRASNRYYRVYDKSAETEGEYEPGTWRYEVEYKQDRAFRLAQRLARQQNLDVDCLHLLSEAYLAYDVITPIVAKPMGWKEQNIVRVSDDQRRLEWLKRSIRPCILRMHEAFDAETLAEALGMYGIIDDAHSYIQSWAAGDPGVNET